MSRAPLFPALVATLRNVAFWVSGFWLATFLDTRQIQGLRFLPFLAAALVICLFFWWFLGKPRPLPVVAGAGALLTLLTSWPPASSSCTVWMPWLEAPWQPETGSGHSSAGSPIC